MAKYDVAHTCGHTQTYDLVGKSIDRERKIKWLGTETCTACKRAAETPIAYVQETVNGPEVFVVHAFGVKDGLKARGYKFGEYIVKAPDRPVDLQKLMIYGGTKGWGKVFASEDALIAELEYLASIDIPMALHLMDRVQTAMAALFTGRPDLIR